jgi:hypothetical protein
MVASITRQIVFGLPDPLPYTVRLDCNFAEAAVRIHSDPSLLSQSPSDLSMFADDMETIKQRSDSGEHVKSLIEPLLFGGMRIGLGEESIETLLLKLVQASMDRQAEALSTAMYPFLLMEDLAKLICIDSNLDIIAV